MPCVSTRSRGLTLLFSRAGPVRPGTGLRCLSGICGDVYDFSACLVVLSSQASSRHFITLARGEWDERCGIFLEKPYHDWTSHGADEYHYAALIDDQQPAGTSPVYPVKPFYPELGF